MSDPLPYFTASLGATPSPGNASNKVTNIGEIDAEIELLESGLYFTRRDTDHIVALKRTRNQQTPIGKLPFEILSLIIRANIIDNDQHYIELHRYAGVSKFWWYTILHTPQLWYIISADLHPKLNEMIVRRATNTLLWVISKNHSRRQRKKVEVFMRFACQFAERWGLLKYTEKFIPEDLKKALPRASMLFDILLFNDDTKNRKPLPTLTLHPGARITDPIFSGVRLSQPEVPVTSSRLICFEWIPESPSLPWFLNLPDKKRLLLLHIRLSLPMSANRISTPTLDILPAPLVLKSARKIILRRMPRVLLLDLITRLSAPLCQGLELTPDIPADLFAIPRFRELVTTPFRNRSIRMPIRLTYWTSTGALELYAYDRPKEGTVWWPAPDFGEVPPPKESSCPDYYIRTFLTNRRDWKDIVSLLNAKTGSRPVYLTLNHGTAAGAGMLDDAERPLPRFEILHDTPRVEILTAVGLNEALPILRFLSHPRTDVLGQLQWPFPRLRCFRFVRFGVYNQEELITHLILFVRLRYGRGRAEAEIPSLPRPVPLTKIVGPKRLCKALKGRKEFDGIIVSHDYTY